MNRWIALFLMMVGCDQCSTTTTPPLVGDTDATPLNTDETVAPDATMPDATPDPTTPDPTTPDPTTPDPTVDTADTGDTSDTGDDPAPVSVGQHQNANAYQHWVSTTATEISQSFMIEEASDDSFFALNLDFVATGRGGYIGWQPTGLLSDGVTKSELVLFSVWDATVAEGDCLPFGGEGVGMSCRIPVTLPIGDWTELTVRQEERTDGLWWIGEVTQDGVITEIGAIKAVEETDMVVSASNFVEYYGPQTACTDVPATLTVIEPPVSPGYDYTQSSTSLGACSGGLVEPDGDTVLLGLGQ